MVKTLNSSRIFSIRKVKNQKKWNKTEDILLIQYAQQFNEKNWKEIASKFSNKNPLQCFSRYKRIKPGIKKGTWKKEEDIKILQLVSKHGKAWSKISKEIGFRNGKQIRDRFLNVLDPSINKNKFSYSEDCRIINLYKRYGAKWAVIAKAFPYRTADMIKNRFHSSIKKHIDEFILKKEDIDEVQDEISTISGMSMGVDIRKDKQSALSEVMSVSSIAEMKNDMEGSNDMMEEDGHEMPFCSSLDMNFFFNGDGHNNELESCDMFAYKNMNGFENDNVFQQINEDNNEVFWQCEEPFGIL